jgi:gluconokinase
MVVVVMGVSGSGKTTVGEALAAELGWDFYDADDFHPAANKEKMHAGIPLTDEDRWPWLAAIRREIERALVDGRGAVVACSALKASYRAALAGGLGSRVVFVLLDGPRQVLEERLDARTDHFMNPALLQSQIDTLERPEDAIVVDISLPTAAQVAAIRSALGA